MMQSISLCDHVTERSVIGQYDLIVERGASSKQQQRCSPIYQVAKKLKCSKNVVTIWVELYKLYGVVGLQRLPQNCRYNYTENCL